jgi:hypothetical protein
MTASNLFAVSLWLIYLAIVVFCLWRLVTSRRSAAERVLWALVVLLLPVIGPILFLWGSRRQSETRKGDSYRSSIIYVRFAWIIHPVCFVVIDHRCVNACVSGGFLCFQYPGFLNDLCNGRMSHTVRRFASIINPR